MKDRALARLVSVAALAFVALTWLGGDAHAVAYPCSKAGLHQGLTAGGVITLSCAQPTTIALTEGGNYLQPIDFDGEGRVTITNAGFFGIVTRAQATFKRTTFAGAAPGGRGVIIQSTAPITFDRVIIRDITPGNEGGSLFITTCATACTSRVMNSTITNLKDGVFEVSGSATLEVTNTTFDAALTPFWTLDAGQVRARYVTIARGNNVGRQFNNGNIRFTSSIIDASTWILGNGTVTSGGYNVIRDGAPASFATATDVVVTAPLTLGLQPLAANGGPTPTVALGSCSAAINAVTDNSAPSTDQRGTGFPRVNQGKPDAGAFESNHTATPCIAEQPADRTIFATQTLTLSVAASGPANRTYQWKKGANNIPGATSATYTKNNAVVGDAGTYSVVVTGPGGSTTSNSATVVVHGPPSISAEPQDVRAFLGQAVTLTVTAQGEGLGYQWHFGAGPISGATSASYEFVANEANAGAYSVVVSNPAGSATSRSAIVTIDGRPVITVDPEDVTLFAGQTLSLDIQAEGVGLSYQWQLEGADIDGATAATYTKVADVADTGSYVALVRNGAGEVASTPAAVVVHGPPVIVTPPSAASVFGSTELTLSVVASGESLSYQWRKDEVEIEDATEATYRVTATSELAGQYDVVVTNPAGSVTADAVAVVVYGPPLIVTPPSGLTARAGDLVSLTVVATGEALTYKWYRDELEVPDATLSTLSFTASEANAGDYIVAVSNPAGTVESEPVTVSLEDEPEPEPEPEPEVEAEPGPELDLEPTPEAAEVETVTKGRSEDGCAGGPTGVFAWLFGLALVLGRRRH